MNRIHRSIRVLAGLFAGVAVALAAGAPAALATPTPPPDLLPRFLPCSPTCANELHAVTPAHIHAAVTGGMPGWQITLIAIGAALLAAATTLLLDRAWIARRHATATVA
ncbi:MAG TPA: hypothetical protein VGF54_21565 [Streptosporangiaceae bacterium]|jgi:hypothetical protein